MDYFIQTLKKLSLISVLNTSITESSIISGSIFSDIRTSLYTRMIELTIKNWDILVLQDYLEKDTSPGAYLHWLSTELTRYKDKDIYINPSYLHTTDNNIFKYELEPKHIEHRYLYYNLSPLKIIWVLQRLSLDSVYFPCKYSLYIEENIDDLIKEVNKKYESN